MCGGPYGFTPLNEDMLVPLYVPGPGVSFAISSVPLPRYNARCSFMRSLVVNFMLGIIEPTEEEAWAADMNSDSLIDVFDIVLLVDAILNGAEDETPAKGSPDLFFR